MHSKHAPDPLAVQSQWDHRQHVPTKPQTDGTLQPNGWRIADQLRCLKLDI